MIFIKILVVGIKMRVLNASLNQFKIYNNELISVCFSCYDLQ